MTTEAISEYVARFSSEQNLSFGDLRTPEEERQVIGYFLKGVRDEKFARISTVNPSLADGRQYCDMARVKIKN